MKIIKFVVATSMILLVSMGITFLLIGSIVIGAQTSTASESKIARIEHNVEMESLREDYEDSRQYIEDNNSLTDEEKNEELAFLEESYNAMVEQAELDYKIAKIEIRDLHRERLVQAFVYEVERMEVNGTVIFYKSQQKLTAPAGLMITGIIFLLTSAPLFMGAFMYVKKAAGKSKKEEKPAEQPAE